MLDAVSSYDAIGFGIFHGDGTPFLTAPAFADRVVTGVEAYHDAALSQQGFGSGDRSEFTYSPPVLADVDEDGTMNVILAGDHEHSNDTTNKGVTVWVLNPDMTRPVGWTSPKDTGLPLSYGEVRNNIVTLAPSPAVGNIDGKPGLEIVVPTHDGKVHPFGPDGTELWTHSFATTGTPYTGASEPLIVDLDGDGVPEIHGSALRRGSRWRRRARARRVVEGQRGRRIRRRADRGSARGEEQLCALGNRPRWPPPTGLRAFEVATVWLGTGPR